MHRSFRNVYLPLYIFDGRNETSRSFRSNPNTRCQILKEVFCISSRYSNKRAKTVNGNLKYRGEEYSSVYYPVPCVRSIAISVEVSRHDHSYTDLCLVIPCFHTCRVEEANERETRVACGSIGEKSLRERKQTWIDSENWMNLLSKFFLRTPPKLNLHFYCEK